MAQHQPAYCLAEEEQDGVAYICSRPAHGIARRHSFIKVTDMPEKQRDAYTALSTTTLEPPDPAADLVLIDGQAPPRASIEAMAELSELVGFIELDRRLELRSYTSKTCIALIQDLIRIKRLLANDQDADRQSLLRIKARVDAWLLQSGIREDGGS
jgi:glutaminase